MISPFTTFAEWLGTDEVEVKSAESYLGPIPDTEPPDDPSDAAREFSQQISEGDHGNDQAAHRDNDHARPRED